MAVSNEKKPGKKTSVVKSGKKKSAKTAVKAKTSSVKKSTANNLKVSKGTSKVKNTVSKVSAKTISSKKKTDKTANDPIAVILGKTYLSDKELITFKELLVEQKTEILENARKQRESLVDENTGDYVGDNSTFSMHMAEQGSDEMERQKAYMFIQRDEKHLFYLENALERIAKKTYGLCVSCGKPINKARLEAVPITSHCINCKQILSS